jgi:hypothetical protein
MTPVKLFPKFLQWMFPCLQPQVGFFCQTAFATAPVTIIEPPDPFRELAAVAIAAGQVLAAKEDARARRDVNNSQIADAVAARTFLKDCRREHRDESMGGQEPQSRTDYIQYIGAMTASTSTFSNLIARGNVLVSEMRPAIDDTNDLYKDLYDLTLRGERLDAIDPTNPTSLRSEEVADATIESNKRRVSITNINTARTNLAQAREDAIKQAFNLESNRIETEELINGFVGGDAVRDTKLLAAKITEQNAIAENNKQTALDNTTATEELEQDIAKRDFDLSQNNRNARFSIREDDVVQRLERHQIPDQKVAQNIAAIEDAPRELANRDFKRRFEREPFRQEAGPVGSSPTAGKLESGPSALGVLFAQGGQIAGSAIRRSGMGAFNGGRDGDSGGGL